MTVPGRRNGLVDDDDNEDDNALFEEEGLIDAESDTPPHLRDLSAAAQLGDVNALRRALEFLRYRGMKEFDQAMHHAEETYGFMTSEHQYISRKDEDDRVIVFERGDLVFVFNFHWNKSYSDYRVGCLKPGKYKIVLDSDEQLFGGFNRIDHNAEFFSKDGWHDNRPNSFMVYTPCRTAVVYALVEG